MSPQRLHGAVPRKSTAVKTPAFTPFIHQYPDFPHSGGHNCNLSAARKVLQYLGLDISEAMLLGIGGNLGFVYWMMKFMATPFIGGFNKFPDSIIRPILHLNGSTTLYKTPSPTKGFKDLCALLRRQPAWTMVDIAYLPYFWGGTSNEAMHFGGHSVVVVGIDESQDTALLSDRFGPLFSVTLTALAQARNAQPVWMKPQHQLVEFHLPSIPTTPIAWREAVRRGLLVNRATMLHPPIQNIGLRGMLKMKAQVARWLHEFSPEQVVRSLTETFLYNESGGSGGAMFRRLYTQFLQEAAEKTDQSWLARAADMYKQAADAWSRVAVDLLPDQFPHLRQIRANILATERYNEDYDAQSVLQLYTEREDLIHAAVQGDITGYQAHIPTLQHSIQDAHDLEQAAWNYLSAQLGPE